jgi:hypothetical protein
MKPAAVPRPRDTLFERGEWHAFDLRQHPAHVVGVGVAQRCDAEAAVATDHRGDAVDVGRRRQRIPEELRVVVRVGVDEARARHETGRVQRVARILAEGARGNDCDDAPVAHADVAAVRRRVRPVDHGRANDPMIKHAIASEPDRHRHQPRHTAHRRAPSATRTT